MSEGFAFVRLPDGSYRVGRGPFTESSEPVDDPCFYVNNWRIDDPTPWKIPERLEVVDDLEEVMKGLDDSVRVSWEPLEDFGFRDAFDEVASLIGAGIARKMVPVVTQFGEFQSPQTGRRLAARIASAGPSLVPYGYMSGANGFVGATPELLFFLSGSDLTTMALAGTARTEARSRFIEDPKEINEHEMVVEHIVARLIEFGVVERLPREIFDLEEICHFCSKIRARISGDVPLNSLIDKLHPTPAVGTLPATDDLRNRLWKMREGLGAPDWFGAPFGYVEREEFLCVVAIRAIGWSGLRAVVPSGCGIVSGSDALREWDELSLKRESVKKLFSL